METGAITQYIDVAQLVLYAVLDLLRGPDLLPACAKTSARAIRWSPTDRPWRHHRLAAHAPPKTYKLATAVKPSGAEPDRVAADAEGRARGLGRRTAGADRQPDARRRRPGRLGRPRRRAGRGLRGHTARSCRCACAHRLRRRAPGQGPARHAGGRRRRRRSAAGGRPVGGPLRSLFRYLEVETAGGGACCCR
jgi:hypothetical protein